MPCRAPALLAVLAGAVVGACEKTPAVPPAAPAVERRALLVRVSGDVKIKRGDSDEWVPAAAGIELARNDKVRTMQGASALIRFDEGTELAVDEESLVSVSDLPADAPHKGGVTVLRGKVDAEVDRRKSQSFTVRTPAGVARSSQEIVFQ